MIRLTFVMFALTALVAAGCGDDDADDSGAADPRGAAVTETGKGAAMEGDDGMAADAAMKAEPNGTIVKVVDSDYGRVIADGKGEAFYLFDREKMQRSECYGACATAWPPVLTKGSPRAGSGAAQKLLGTTKRRNGKRQVTYAGHPLYYYKDDSPGNILCQNVDEFGGLWLVVKPNGRPVG